jgi:hypothetical protein
VLGVAETWSPSAADAVIWILLAAGAVLAVLAAITVNRRTAAPVTSDQS